MEEFIREQIKEKPLSKKKIALKLGVAALCGLVFALVACAVFAMLFPRITGGAHNTETLGSETETLPAVIKDTETESVETETQESVKPEPITIDEYQRLQNEIYAIGNSANSSIVSVTSVTSDTDWFNNSYESLGTGAGVIIAEDNSKLYILTERRVIKAAKSISVSFINDVVADADLLKYDGNTGIAILTVKKEQLSMATISAIKVAQLGNSNRVSKGMITIALGSPLGTNYSILTGSITSTVNEISTIDNNYGIFTTDIVSNNDGSGIIINVDGEVIGIVMQDYNATSTGNTLTAVAISEVKDLLDILLKGKDVPYFGLHVVTVTERIAKEHDLPNGVYIKEVKVDSPAMIAGLQNGDVIVEIDGTEINNVKGYNAKLLTLTPEETYKVKVMRKAGDGYSEITCEVVAGVLQ